MRIVQATVTRRENAWGQFRLTTIHVAGLGAVLPGQYLLAYAPHDGRTRLPRALLPCGYDPFATSVDVLLTGADLEWFDQMGWQVGDILQVAGPLGRPFIVDPRARRLLLVGGGPGLGPLPHLARFLTEQGKEITYIAWRGSDEEPMPARFLPPEVEYVISDAAPDASGVDPILVTMEALISWADGLYLALPGHLLPGVTDLMRRRLLRLRKGYAQVLLVPLLLPCGVGACDLCVRATRDGYRRLCRDGLVFDLLSVS